MTAVISLLSILNKILYYIRLVLRQFLHKIIGDRYRELSHKMSKRNGSTHHLF